MQQFWDNTLAFLTGAGWKALAFVVALFVGVLAVRAIMAILKRVFAKSKLESTPLHYILTVVRFALYLLLFFILAAIVGIPMSPLVTALGAVALAVGLALKDSLSNLANGVMLLGTKPFKEGDYVDMNGIAGTVLAVKMFTTELVTPDNKKITVPNSYITAANVVNYSAKPVRRVEWKFSVAYGSDMETVKAAVGEALSSHDKVLSDPAYTVRLGEYGQSALIYVARAWVRSDDYWDVFFDINEAVLRSFDRHEIRVPFDQLDVHLDGRAEE